MTFSTVTETRLPIHIDGLGLGRKAETKPRLRDCAAQQKFLEDNEIFGPKFRGHPLWQVYLRARGAPRTLAKMSYHFLDPLSFANDRQLWPDQRLLLLFTMQKRTPVNNNKGHDISGENETNTVIFCSGVAYRLVILPNSDINVDDIPSLSPL